MLLFFAKSAPTDEIRRQWGHLANALVRVLNWKNIFEKLKFNQKIMRLPKKLKIYLSSDKQHDYCWFLREMKNFAEEIYMMLTRKVSWQWPQVTRHIPGIVGTGGVTGLGAKLIIRLQFGLGHATRCEELLHINKQLQGQRTYFLPGGAFLIG